VIGILGTGSYLPKEEIGNDEIGPRFDVTSEWIERKTMIRTRRYVAADEAASDLAIRAAEKALEQAGVPADRIDHLIVSTSTGDFVVPQTSCLVQTAIGADRAACMDVNVACSGFVYGTALARGLLTVSPGSYALVVATDVWSRFIDPNDRSTAVLLGDGAGAAVLGPVPSSAGIIEIGMRGHGALQGLLVVDAGGSRRPASAETVRENGHVLRMQGREVTDFVLGHVPGAVHEVLTRAGVRPDQVDHFVPHQANGVLLGKLTEAAGLTGAQTHLTVAQYGNIGSASIPVTLDEANRAGTLHNGDLVLLAGFGGGMAQGVCLMRWYDGVAE
jgi:acetoacetyl-CoA synthase